MTRLFDLPVGRSHEFLVALQNAGFTLEQADAVISEPSKAAAMVSALSDPAVLWWYKRSPEEQLAAVANLNRARSWGFSGTDFPSLPENVRLGPSEVLSLAVYLPRQGRMNGLWRTIEELWSVVPEKIGHCSKQGWGRFKPDFGHLRLAQHRDGSKREWKPGIRWVVIDLTAKAGESPQAVLETTSADSIDQPAGVELLALLLFQPDWVTAMDGKSFFYPHLASIQSRSYRDWSSVPYIYRRADRYRCDFGLDTYWSGNSPVGWSSPFFREY